MMLPRSLSLRVWLNSSSNWRGPPKRATMTIKLRLREPGMMIFDWWRRGNGFENHRLVLFTHALCQLSYLPWTALRPAGIVERPAGRHLHMRRCGASKSPQGSNGQVGIRFVQRSWPGALGSRSVTSSARMLSSFARATSRQPGRPSENKMEEKFIVVWTINGETMSIPHSTQDEALHQAETLLREHGCDLEITLHLDDDVISAAFHLVQ